MPLAFVAVLDVLLNGSLGARHNTVQALLGDAASDLLYRAGTLHVAMAQEVRASTARSLRYATQCVDRRRVDKLACIAQSFVPGVEHGVHLWFALVARFFVFAPIDVPCW